MNPVVILFAMEREIAPFRRGTARESIATLDLVHCGVGATAADRAVDALLPRRPGLILLAGFSGGLVAHLRVGQLVLATQVRTASGASFPVTQPLAVADAVAGPILATDRMVVTPAEKRALHEQTGALAVDMESATVARRCQEAGVPFGCLRVLSDELASELPPELERFFEGGRVRPLRLLIALVRRPRLLGELLTLARASRQAAAALAEGLRQAVSSLPPGSHAVPAGG